MQSDPRIRIKIVQLGREVREYEAPTRCTIGEALAAVKVHIDRLRTDIRLNGESASPTSLVSDGDVITLLPPIRGGTARPSALCPRPVQSDAEKPRSPAPGSRPGSAGPIGIRPHLDVDPSMILRYDAA